MKCKIYSLLVIAFVSVLSVPLAAQAQPADPSEFLRFFKNWTINNGHQGFGSPDLPSSMIIYSDDRGQYYVELEGEEPVEAAISVEDGRKIFRGDTADGGYFIIFEAPYLNEVSEHCITWFSGRGEERSCRTVVSPEINLAFDVYQNGQWNRAYFVDKTDVDEKLARKLFEADVVDRVQKTVTRDLDVDGTVLREAKSVSMALDNGETRNVAPSAIETVLDLAGGYGIEVETETIDRIPRS